MKAKSKSDPEDPQKGKWGGLAERHGRKLSATVKKAGGHWYKLALKVEATDRRRALDGYVVFYLHDTFTPDRVRVAAKNDRAVLKIFSWGSFTVGAAADGGKTKLELNLADLPNIPRGFREN